VDWENAQGMEEQEALAKNINNKQQTDKNTEQILYISCQANENKGYFSVDLNE